MARRILVVGGGVVGCSIAWHLSQRDLGEVVLLERDRLGSGTTWHSAGNLTWRPGASHDENVLYAFETIARLTAETGQETGWLKTGRLFLAHGQAAIRRLETYQEAAKERGVDSRIVTGPEAARLHPLLRGEAITAAWFNPLSGRLNPADLTAAYAKGARARGARIVENCKVTGFTLQQRPHPRRRDIDRPDGSRSGRRWRRACGRAACWRRPACMWRNGPAEHFYVIADVTPRLPRETPSFVAPEDLFYGREEVGGMMVGSFDENAKTLDAAALPIPLPLRCWNPTGISSRRILRRQTRSFRSLETAPIRRFVNGPENLHAG